MRVAAPRLFLMLAFLGLSVPEAWPGQELITPGVIQKVDGDLGNVEVFAGGQNRTLKIASDARFLDAEGKDLPEGVRSKELKPGVEVVLRVDRSGGVPLLKSLRLGRAASGAPPLAPPEKVDTSGLVPLPDLGPGEYKGFPGGLYPDGRNERPPAHEARGLALAGEIQALDEHGKPDPSGKIVLLTVGMSNTSQDSTAFAQLANADPQKNPHVIIVNGAQGGMTAARIQNPEDGGSGAKYWGTVDERLKSAGASRSQVQAVWLKEADASPDQGFPKYAQTLREELVHVVQALAARFPKLRLCYLSSRTYGGYAQTRLNPEPYAYESGFSVKWLIDQQLKGDPPLNSDPARGPVLVPWLSWGPYLWANGSRARADGFKFEEQDFGKDGTHPSELGQKKVGELLLKFFKRDSTTRDWFLRK
jgi:hypothetical protein